MALVLEDGITEIQASITIASDLTEVGQARRWIADLAANAGIASRLSYDLQLVLSEACTNSIKHSYCMEPGHDVVMSASIDAQRVRLSVRDHGKRFDPEAYREPDLDNAREGGYGVYIMRQLMDEVRFELSHDEGNEVILVKFR